MRMQQPNASKALAVQGGLAGAKGPKAKKRNVFGASVEEIWCVLFTTSALHTDP